MNTAPSTLEDMLVGIARQLSRLDRRSHKSQSVQPTTVAAVHTRTAIPPEAAPGAGFIVIEEDTLIVRTSTGWSEFDAEGAAWTLPSYLATRGLV